MIEAYETPEMDIIEVSVDVVTASDAAPDTDTDA